MYKNLNKIVKVIDAIECLNEVDYMIAVLTSFDTNSKYDRSGRFMTIKADGKEIQISDGPLFKIFKYYCMLQDYDDFMGYLDLTKWYLNFFNNQFNFLDLANKLDEVITIRKQYNAYNPEIDNLYLEAVKQYFKDLHNLLLELDKFKKEGK